MSDSQLCPCGSGKVYMQCCGGYHQEQQLPPSAEALLRSRYCAYVRDDQGYIQRTWHSSTRPSQQAADGGATRWRGLEILNQQGGAEGDSRGEIEFVVRYAQQGVVRQLHERSRFVREAGQWFYLDGDDLPPVNEIPQQVGRNDPCPCGSGKKYKKCCG